MSNDNVRRIVGDLVFLYGDAEVEAAGRNLRKGGFDFKITDDVDQYSDATRFVHVWRDELASENTEAQALTEFCDDIETLLGKHVDNYGVVDPDHMPVHFGE